MRALQLAWWHLRHLVRAADCVKRGRCSSLGLQWLSSFLLILLCFNAASNTDSGDWPWCWLPHWSSFEWSLWICNTDSLQTHKIWRPDVGYLISGINSYCVSLDSREHSLHWLLGALHPPWNFVEPGAHIPTFVKTSIGVRTFKSVTKRHLNPAVWWCLLTVVEHVWTCAVY